MVAGAFAADFKATVQMESNIVEKTGAGIDFLKLVNRNQKDDDALIFTGGDDKAGGQFQLWYEYDGSNGENIYTEVGGKDGDPNKSQAVHGIRIRNVNLWFKPVDMLKVTVGDSTLDSFKEHIFWWHGIYGAKPGTWGGFGGEYIAGNGFKFELTPAGGFSFTAAILPGNKTPFFSTAANAKIGKFGIKAGYNFGVGNAAAVFTMDGDNKYIAVGADYGNEWAEGFYAFLNVNMKMGADGLTGIAFDNSEKFTAGALVAQAHLPVVLYKENNKFNVGMYVTLKGTYNLGSCSPYLLITNEPDGDAGWCFDNFAFKMTFQPGVTFNVGAAGFEIAARFDINDGLAGFKVPCIIKCGL